MIRTVLLLPLATGLALFLLACAGPVTRDHPVGRTSRAFVDSSRTAWDDSRPRPLATRIWYPAEAGSTESEWSAGGFRFGKSAPDAAFADDRRRPLILLSHGTGGSAAQLSWLAEALAEAGFIVAGVDHHGNTATEESYHPGGFVLPGERIRDLSVLLDRLLGDPDIGPHVDSTRVGAAGFSLGGFTVLGLAGATAGYERWRQQCATEETHAPWCMLPPKAPFTLADVDTLLRTNAAMRAALEREATPTLDMRISAVAAMAPALVPVIDTLSLGVIARPLLVLLGERDAQVPVLRTASTLERHVENLKTTRLTDVAHYAFLAPCTLRGRLFVRPLCEAGGTTREAVHQRAASEVVAFFRNHL